MHTLEVMLADYIRNIEASHLPERSAIVEQWQRGEISWGELMDVGTSPTEEAAHAALKRATAVLRKHGL